MAEIHKAAGILIRDRKLLVERSKGKDFFISPGGSIEAGETAPQALVRELLEEFQIIVYEEDLTPFGTFTAQAANEPDKTVEMETYTVSKWEGEPTAYSEVEEIAWINSQIPASMQVGSIFEHDVIPELVNQGLID